MATELLITIRGGVVPEPKRIFSMINGFLDATLDRTPDSPPLRLGGYKMVALIGFRKADVWSIQVKDNLVIEYSSEKGQNYSLEDFRQYLNQAMYQFRGYQMLEEYNEVLKEHHTDVVYGLHDTLLLKCCPCGHKDCNGSVQFSKNPVCLRY